MMNAAAVDYNRYDSTYKPVTTYVPDSATVHRGDIFLADLSPVIGCEQGGVRAVVVIQNEVGNRHSPTVIVAAISSARKQMITHVALDANEFGLQRDSYVLLEQIRTIDRNRLDRKITTLSKEKMKEVDNVLKISLGITQ